MKTFTEFLLEKAPLGAIGDGSNVALSTAANPIIPISSKAKMRRGTGMGFDNIPDADAKELRNHPEAKPGDSLWHIINKIVAKENYIKTKEIAQKWGTDIEDAPNMISPLDSYREATMKFSEYQQATLEMLEKHRQEILFRIWDSDGEYQERSAEDASDDDDWVDPGYRDPKWEKDPNFWGWWGNRPIGKDETQPLWHQLYYLKSGGERGGKLSKDQFAKLQFGRIANWTNTGSDHGEERGGTPPEERKPPPPGGWEKHPDFDGWCAHCPDDDPRPMTTLPNGNRVYLDEPFRVS